MSDYDSGGSSSRDNVDKKRKRKIVTAPEDELEIDVNLPEPPSKKAKRLEKKKAKKEKTDTAENKKPKTATDQTSETQPKDEGTSAASKRSEYGIWIGNLPWSATKDSLRQFLIDNGPIDDQDITRLHLPAPADKPSPQQRLKPQNKGFAYVDFRTSAALDRALALSEKLLVGRRVLIKNAKSFEGRPDKSNTELDAAKASAKPPAKRIFVGNLDFSVTQDELFEHYSQAGEVKDVHVATFEDSGKCKGYAWVRFVELEAAEAAVRGYIFKKPSRDNDEEEVADEEDGVKGEENEESDSTSKKKTSSKDKKNHKWFINRLHGRPLRCEFAEDAQTRFKKRFGKEGKTSDQGEDVADSNGPGEEEAPSPPAVKRAEPVKRLRRDAPWVKKRDARTIAPGKALSSAPRSSAAIVAGAGKKVTFD